MTITDSCRDCGGQIERVDTPLPAYAAPAPWWFHTSDIEAQCCPGTGPVQPAERELVTIPWGAGLLGYPQH